MRSPPAATTATCSPTGARWSATGPGGLSTAIHPDGILTATGHHGTIHLPARYVTDHVELGYATTAAAAQGRTVDHALVVIDRPCDVRNLYVAMTRGRHSNDAYLATPGETTAQDVFTQCLIGDWIDQPAHTRRAEIRGEAPHRAGLLDGAVLRGLLERRHQLADELQRAEARQQRLPGELRHSQAAKTAAEQRIVALRAEQRRLQGVIADLDRRLRRHRHHDEIDSARRRLADIPYRIDRTDADLVAANDTLDRLNTGATETRAVLAQRGDIDDQLADIDDQLAADLRIRTRVTRREQPEAVVALLGSRPEPGHEAHGWDMAAGRLAQHHAAFDLEAGLGPHPDYWNRSAYRDSHEDIAALIGPDARPVIERSIEPPDLGLSL